MKIVQKYGGSSLADDDCIRRVASRILEDSKNNQIAVVVSAQGKTTDQLTKKYGSLSQQFPSRESDALLSTGEQASAALLASTLVQMGAKAVSLNGAQLPIRATGCFGDGRIESIDTRRIRKEWKSGKIVIVTGFQGVTSDGDVITLGRGGSDTSAVALAAALNADRCMIFTDVDGVYSADPRKVSDAVRYPSIHLDSMLNLATLGAKVLHPRSTALAKQYNVSLEVLTSFSTSEGTCVSSDSPYRTGVTVSRSDETAVVSVVCGKQIEDQTLKKLTEISLNSGAQVQFGAQTYRAFVPSQIADELLNQFHEVLYS